MTEKRPGGEGRGGERQLEEYKGLYNGMSFSLFLLMLGRAFERHPNQGDNTICAGRISSAALRRQVIILIQPVMSRKETILGRRERRFEDRPSLHVAISISLIERSQRGF